MSEAPPITPDTPIQYAKGVGPARAAQLTGLGIKLCADLVTYYPRDYIRYEGEQPISTLRPGEMVTLTGTLLQTRLIRKRPVRFEALIDDGSARAVLTWFNPYGIDEKLSPGTHIRVTGKTTAFGGRIQIVQGKFQVLEAVDGDRVAAGPRIEAIYAATEEITSPQIARIVHNNLDFLLPSVREWFDGAYVKERNLLTRHDATLSIHKPRDMKEAQRARRTLAYHEFFLHQTAVAVKRYHQRMMQKAMALRVDDKVDARIRALLPFELTAAQGRVIEAIKKDLAVTKPMNRLLQGDVGSGKTVVALYAMLAGVATAREPERGDEPKAKGKEAEAFRGHQAALMAPTEILAEQHFVTISKLLEGKRVRVALLVGGMPAKEKGGLQKQLAAGDIDIVVGTHALISEGVAFKSLAVVVIDEQHKFGVEQRSILRAKHGSGAAPHTLVMTATPIPRTLAMTAFGDLDVSVIDELPPGRHAIHTKFTTAASRQEVYAFVAERLKAKEQAYVVLPAIDEGVLDLNSATGTQQELQSGWLKDFRVGLIHGRMERATRQHIMERFRQHLIDVLVATTVIEVGVDVPNATVMVIEHADRFGLSQLHQLRGRVGRSDKKSFCVLIGDQNTDDSIARLGAMVKHASGFKIAEEDLRIRGMGQLVGTAQSGKSDMHFADLLFDTELLGMARRDAFRMIAADPRLLGEGHEELRKELLKTFGETITLADVG